MSEQASTAAGGSGMIDFEAQVGFRLGMSAAALADHLVQAGFSRTEAESAAERVYARRLTAVQRNGFRLLLVGAVVFPVVAGMLVLVLMSGWFVKILAIAHLVGVGMIVAGVKHVSEVRAAGGSDERERSVRHRVRGPHPPTPGPDCGRSRVGTGVGKLR